SIAAGTGRRGPMVPGTSTSRPSGRNHSCSTVLPTSVSPTSKETDVTEGTQFYYNLSTGAVEERAPSPATELMGPYAPREAAARALSTAAERNRSWDEENAEWDDYGSEGTGPETGR